MFLSAHAARRTDHRLNCQCCEYGERCKLGSRHISPFATISDFYGTNPTDDLSTISMPAWNATGNAGRSLDLEIFYGTNPTDDFSRLSTPACGRMERAALTMRAHALPFSPRTTTRECPEKSRNPTAIIPAERPFGARAGIRYPSPYVLRTSRPT